MSSGSIREILPPGVTSRMMSIRRASIALFFLISAVDAAASSYRDYDSTFVPKSDRRRVALSLVVDRNGVDRGSMETKTLHAMLLARFTGVPEFELLPRLFVNADESMLAKLRALEVDDLVELRLAKLRPPVVSGPSSRSKEGSTYVLDGSIAAKNVMSGSVVAETTLERLVLPEMEAYADELDGTAATLMAITAYTLDFYQKQQALFAMTPRGNAADAAAAAESAGNWDEAALILADITRKDPTQEAALRDRRDLAAMRAGRSPAGSGTSGGATASAAAPPITAPGKLDLLDPVNRGKSIPVSQGSIPVRTGITTNSWSMSVSLMMKDAGARGGILASSKTKNLYLGISPSTNEIVLESQNLVTNSVESRGFPIPAGQFALNKTVRMEARYDGGFLTVNLNGTPVIPQQKVILDNVGFFIFGKLSTVYFQDASLLQ